MSDERPLRASAYIVKRRQPGLGPETVEKAETSIDAAVVITRMDEPRDRFVVYYQGKVHELSDADYAAARKVLNP